jgi:hypothetical protein
MSNATIVPHATESQQFAHALAPFIDTILHDAAQQHQRLHAIGIDITEEECIGQIVRTFFCIGAAPAVGFELPAFERIRQCADRLHA